MADSDQRQQLRPIPMAAGMLLGAATGFLLWLGTDTFALFPAFLGVGLVLGMVLSGAELGRRH
jgi:hypothetical protein